MALHTLNCSVSSPSFPQISPRDTRPCLFQSSYPELNPHKRNSQITRSKISYSFIEPQPLPCTADCDYQFHTLVVSPSPKFTLTLVGSAFGIFVVDVRRISKCDSVWGVFHHWGYTRESWTPAASWFSWFAPNTRTIGWDFVLTPCPNFL